MGKPFFSLRSLKPTTKSFICQTNDFMETLNLPPISLRLAFPLLLFGDYSLLSLLFFFLSSTESLFVLYRKPYFTLMLFSFFFLSLSNTFASKKLLSAIPFIFQFNSHHLHDGPTLKIKYVAQWQYLLRYQGGLHVANVNFTLLRNYFSAHIGKKHSPMFWKKEWIS